MSINKDQLAPVRSKTQYDKEYSQMEIRKPVNQTDIWKRMNFHSLLLVFLASVGLRRMSCSTSSRVQFHYDPHLDRQKIPQAGSDDFSKAEKILKSLWQRHSDWSALTELQFKDIRATNDPKDHMSRPGILLEKFADNRWAADILLHFEKARINVHSAVVAAHSEFFRRIVSEHEPPLSVSLTLLPLTIEGLQEAIDFMYRGRLVVCSTTLPRLLQAASTLQILGMQERLETYLLHIARKHRDFSLYCLQLSLLYPSSETLRKSLLEICAEHFSRIAQNREFLMVGKECLMALLSQNLSLSEKDKFDVALRWLRCNMEEIPHFNGILDFINFKEMTRMDLLRCEQAAQEAAKSAGMKTEFALRQRTMEANWEKGYSELKEESRIWPLHSPFAKEELTPEACFIFPAQSENSGAVTAEVSPENSSVAEDESSLKSQTSDDDLSITQKSNVTESVQNTENPLAAGSGQNQNARVFFTPEKSNTAQRKVQKIMNMVATEEEKEQGNRFGPNFNQFVGLEGGIPTLEEHLRANQQGSQGSNKILGQTQ